MSVILGRGAGTWFTSLPEGRAGGGGSTSVFVLQVIRRRGLQKKPTEAGGGRSLVLVHSQPGRAVSVEMCLCCGPVSPGSPGHTEEPVLFTHFSPVRELGKILVKIVLFIV